MGLKKNIIYNVVLTTSNYIFPLIVYPYISRVLGVEKIGLCNFIDSIINYFILFSMMGINIMGSRQIAADRALNKNLDKPFSSLLGLNCTTTFFAILVLFGLTFWVPDLQENKELMFCGALKLVSNLFLIEWFYKGLEDFRYITVRTIIVKCLYVASIFIFIHEASDYKSYYLLTVFMITGNSIINIIHSRKFAAFSFKEIDFKDILKPFFILGVYMLLTSFCTTFNTVFLGFKTNDIQVGYFTTATKIYSITLAIFTGITTVMLPRMSHLIASKQLEEFKLLLRKTTSMLFSLGIPVIIVTVIFSPQIIQLISGPGYEGATTPMRIVMFLLLIIGYEQIAIIQCLMPLKKDKIIMINATCGAIVSILINLLLVYRLEAVGSAIALLSAEFTILLLSQFAMSKHVDIKFPIRELLSNILYYMPLLLIMFIIFKFFTAQYWVQLIMVAGIAILYVAILQIFVLRNTMFTTLLEKVKSIKTIKYLKQS